MKKLLFLLGLFAVLICANSEIKAKTSTPDKVAGIELVTQLSDAYIMVAILGPENFSEPIFKCETIYTCSLNCNGICISRPEQFDFGNYSNTHDIYYNTTAKNKVKFIDTTKSNDLKMFGLSRGGQGDLCV